MNPPRGSNSRYHRFAGEAGTGEVWTLAGISMGATICPHAIATRGSHLAGRHESNSRLRDPDADSWTVSHTASPVLTRDVTSAPAEDAATVDCTMALSPDCASHRDISGQRPRRQRPPAL